MNASVNIVNGKVSVDYTIYATQIKPDHIVCFVPEFKFVFHAKSKEEADRRADIMFNAFFAKNSNDLSLNRELQKLGFTKSFATTLTNKRKPSNRRHKPSVKPNEHFRFNGRINIPPLAVALKEKPFNMQLQ